VDKIFLDSDVVINILKKKEETIKKLKSLKNSRFFISPIVVAEIYAGARDNEKKDIEKLFSYFESIDIDTTIGRLAGEYAKRYKKAYNKISLEDYLIAASVKVHNLKLWTYNKKHYSMDVELI